MQRRLPSSDGSDRVSTPNLKFIVSSLFLFTLFFLQRILGLIINNGILFAITYIWPFLKKKIDAMCLNSRRYPPQIQFL